MLKPTGTQPWVILKESLKIFFKQFRKCLTSRSFSRRRIKRLSEKS